MYIYINMWILQGIIYIYIARVFREEFCFFTFHFLFIIIERDEIRRSINKTNIHAFLKHYYYKYWLTPWQTPCERARAKKYAFGTTRSTASISSRRRKLFAFHPFCRASREGRRQILNASETHTHKREYTAARWWFFGKNSPFFFFSSNRLAYNSTIVAEMRQIFASTFPGSCVNVLSIYRYYTYV